MDLRFLLLLEAAHDQRLLRSELASQVGVPPSVAAKRLGPMERMGLVERTSAEGGASQVELTLTDAGRTMAQDAGRTAREIAADLIERRFTLDELDQLTELLGRLDPANQL
jgi:DNA-binding MarR family transcriptional regulator